MSNIATSNVAVIVPMSNVAVIGSGHAPTPASGCARAAHPNDLDLRRVRRALDARQRYRYVTPQVSPTIDGYKVQSPCCSRNVDPEGGLIDIALILFDGMQNVWRLLRKNHESGIWEYETCHAKLSVVLDYLNEDAQRRFWQ